MSVSVAIPTRGRPGYLRLCLESVHQQTLQPGEIVVCDDGADPATERVASDFGCRYACNNPPLGQAANRRRAFELTTGELVAMVDDDDTWAPAFLKGAVAALAANPQCGFCSTDQLLIDETGEVLVDETRRAREQFGRASMGTGMYDDVLVRVLRNKPFPLGATVFRRVELEAVGFIPVVSEGVDGTPDFAVFLELGSRRVAAWYLDEPLGRYRIHKGQQRTRRVENGISLVTILRRHGTAGLSREERRLLASLHRRTVIELAIAHAHEQERTAALGVLRDYNSLGRGLPSARRVAVLAALLAGLRPRR